MVKNRGQTCQFLVNNLLNIDFYRKCLKWLFRALYAILSKKNFHFVNHKLPLPPTYGWCVDQEQTFLFAFFGHFNSFWAFLSKKIFNQRTYEMLYFFANFIWVMIKFEFYWKRFCKSWRLSQINTDASKCPNNRSSGILWNSLCKNL